MTGTANDACKVCGAMARNVWGSPDTPRFVECAQCGAILYLARDQISGPPPEPQRSAAPSSPTIPIPQTLLLAAVLFFFCAVP